MSKKEDLERVRRRERANSKRLFRHRWGYDLPDDQARREDLWLLMLNASLATSEPDKKMMTSLTSGHPGWGMRSVRAM